MICGVFGLPGAGKTTFLTWCARRALAGKPLRVGHLWAKIPLGEFDHYDRVYSTFPVKGAYKFDYDCVGVFQFERCLILIDEMSHLQDNRDFKTYDAGKKYFFSMARHMMIDLIYCSQSYTDCDLKIRNMTTRLFLIQKRAFDRSRISPVKPEWLVQGKELSVGYTLAPSISCTTLNRRKLYEYFDSFDFHRLPPVPAIPWIQVDGESQSYQSTDRKAHV